MTERSDDSILAALQRGFALVNEPVILVGRARTVIGFSPPAANVVLGLRIGQHLPELTAQQLGSVTVISADMAPSDGAALPVAEPNGGNRGRLESLGSIASGVAHDINNIVTGILGHVSYLRILLGKEGKHVESLQTIEGGAKRAAALSQQVLKFSKSEELVPTRVDTREVVTSTLALLRAALPPGCGLSSALGKASCRVLAIETQISQIVMNLVVNARDAVGTNGQIDVQLDAVNSEEELSRAFRGADRSAASYVRLIVADNGQGMSEEVKRRMFEPYFSTKKANGTGLGLSTVNQIVKQFGGAIVVDSSVGRGTTIAVYLPEVSEGNADPEDAVKVEPSRGKGRILVVDDEYSVRNVLCLSLEHLGYEVVVASGGPEAVEIYKDAEHGSIHLVLLDMIMPDMGGDLVFAELQRIDPDVPVMVVSGFASGASIQGILDAGGLDYLPKPFTIEELARKVKSCLASDE